MMVYMTKEMASPWNHNHSQQNQIVVVFQAYEKVYNMQEDIYIIVK